MKKKEVNSEGDASILGINVGEMIVFAHHAWWKEIGDSLHTLMWNTGACLENKNWIFCLPCCKYPSQITQQTSSPRSVPFSAQVLELACVLAVLVSAHQEMTATDLWDRSAHVEQETELKREPWHETALARWCCMEGVSDIPPCPRDTGQGQPGL